MSAVRINDDACVHVLENSRHIGESDAKIQERIAEAMGSGLQHLELTMGNGYQKNNMEQLMSISDHPKFISHAERHSLSSAVDAELSAEMIMQLDLIQAAGSMTSNLKDIIVEISAKAETLTQSQKLKFSEVIFNTNQLQQANDGRISLLSSDIEKMAQNTLEIMRELAVDVVLPPSLKSVSLDVIKETAKKFRLPELDDAVSRFEQDTSPTKILDQTVDTLKATLMALLDQDDLDDDVRKNIKDTLEKLNELPDGEPIPRDILKSLDIITVQLPNTASLSTQVHALREANIAVKAEKFNLSVEQVRAIEATMDRLDALGEELPKDDITLKDMVAEAILVLDKDPVSIKSMAKLEAVTDALQQPSFKALEQTSPILKILATPIITSSKFVQKLLADNVAQKLNIPVKSVQNFVNFYKTVDVQQNHLSDKDTVLKTMIKATLSNFNTNPISIENLANLDRLTAVVSQDKSISFSDGEIGKASFVSNIKSLSPIITNAVAKAQNIPQQSVKKFVEAYNVVQDTLSNIPASSKLAINTVKETLTAITTAPASIATAGLVKLVSNLPSVKIAMPQAKPFLDNIQKIQIGLVSRAQKIPLDVAKSAVDMVVSLVTMRDSGISPDETTKKNPVVESLNILIQKISNAPTSIGTLVNGAEVLYAKGLESTNNVTKNVIDGAKKQFENFKDNVVIALADKGNQPIKNIKENIANILSDVMPGTFFNANSAPKFSPTSYQQTAIPVGLDIDNTPIKKPSLFKKFTGACGDCAGGFCAACKSGISKTLEMKGRKVLTSAFNSFSGVFKKPEQVMTMGKKAKPSQS